MLPVCINIRYNVNISKQSTATSGHMYSYTTFLVMLAVVSANALSCSGTCYLPHRLCECLQADVENYLQQFWCFFGLLGLCLGSVFTCMSACARACVCVCVCVRACVRACVFVFWSSVCHECLCYYVSTHFHADGYHSLHKLKNIKDYCCCLPLRRC